jgi:hypothetical protein
MANDRLLSTFGFKSVSLLIQPMTLSVHRPVLCKPKDMAGGATAEEPKFII